MFVRLIDHGRWINLAYVATTSQPETGKDCGVTTLVVELFDIQARSLGKANLDAFKEALAKL